MFTVFGIKKSFFLSFIQSIASPYFKDLFVDNPSPHPVIMLRHTYAEDLESILEFIYQGEAQVRPRPGKNLYGSEHKYGRISAFSGYRASGY
jgi:hypothetical protein